MRPTITLVGRARNLVFDAETGTATWSIFVNRDQGMVHEFAMAAHTPSTLEQFERMDEGMLIGVIAEVPPAKHRHPGAVMLVQRLELLGKPAAKEVA